ncbi:MAG: hypothetical protein AAF806_11685 [Bacteroidota bacterium]
MPDLAKNDEQEHTLNAEFNGRVYTLFTADVWLSKNSYDLQGVFSSRSKAVEYAREEQLLDLNGENQVVIYEGKLDCFDEGLEEVFNTQRDEDRMVLMPN